MKVNEKLKQYIEKNILPEYQKNDEGHNLDHAMCVIRRSFVFANMVDEINYDMVYTVAAYHDVAVHVDRENHEKLSGEILAQDKKLREFFRDEEIQIMKEAVEDHRASLEEEPRSVYGKIVSSADWNTRIEIVFIRSFFVVKERQPGSVIEDYLEYTYKRLSKRYGEESPENMFYEDEIYQVFLS